MIHVCRCICQVEKKRKEKTTPFGVNLMRSQVLYRAAQNLFRYSWFAVTVQLNCNSSEQTVLSDCTR